MTDEIDPSQVEWEQPYTPPAVADIDPSEVTWDKPYVAAGEKPGWLSEFAGGAVSGITALPKTAYDLLTSPVQTAKGIWEGHKSKASEALAELEKLGQIATRGPNEQPRTLQDRIARDIAFAGSAGKAALAGAGALVPVVGPGMAEMVKGVASADPRAAGEAVGGMLTGPLLKGLGKAAGAVGSKAKATAAAVERPAIDLTPLQRGETGIRAQTEAALRQAIPTAQMFTRADEANTVKLKAVADDMLDRISQKRDLTPEQFGAEWKTTQKQLTKQARKDVEAEYDAYLKPEIQKAGLSGFVDTKLFRAVAKRVEKQLETPQGVERSGLSKTMRKYSKLPKEVSFEVMMDIRNRLRDQLDTAPKTFEPLTQRATAYESHLIEAATKSMDAAAKRGKFKSSFDLAEARKAEYLDTWESSSLKALSKAKPSQVAATLESMPIEGLKRVKAQMPAESLQAASAHMLEKWLTQSMEGKGLQATGRIMGTKLQSGLSTKGLDRLEVLLGKSKLAEVKQFADLVKKTQPPSTAGVIGRKFGSGMNMAFVLGLTYGAATGNFMPVGMTYLASRSLAKALLRQKGSGAALARMTNAVEKAGGAGAKVTAPGIQIPALALQKILDREMEEDDELGPPESSPNPATGE